MSTTQSITSIGHACAVLNRPFAVVKRAMADLNLKPSLYVNGVAHYDDADVDKAREHLAQPRERTGGR